MFWSNLHEIDQQATLFLNGLHCGVTDSIMVFFSKVPVWIPMYVLVAVFLFFRLGWKKATVAVLSIALTFLLCDQIANLFAVSSSMAFRNDKRLKYRGWSAWVFFWAAMVSISRIFVGKHYLGDVLTGIVFGTLIGLACGYAARLVMKKLPEPAGIKKKSCREDIPQGHWNGPSKKNV